MSEAVEMIIESLRETILREVAQERARANEAERSHQGLLNGLRKLLNDMPDANGDSGSSTPSEQSRRTEVQPRSSLPDEVFLCCLTDEWITAGQIFKRLRARGVKVAEGTVYNRMRALGLAQAKDIETAVSPERWRLRGKKVVGSSNHKEARRVRTRPSSVAKASTGPATCSISAPVLSPPRRSTDHSTLHHGDCLKVMRTLADNSVDLILADLPYGTTGLDIDRRLPMDELWAEYRRILRKPHGNIVLFGSQPFTSMLVNSAPDIFRHSLVWEKNKATGFQHASAKPLKRHEDILVFSYGVNISEKRTEKRATYNPQGAIKVAKKAQGLSDVRFLAKAIRGHEKGTEFEGLTKCPDSILRFPKSGSTKGKKAHPFAKPVALLEYLIRTYSNEGEVVLDNTMGSGSTGVAALNVGRHFIGIEKDDEWFEVARERIEAMRVADEQPVASIRHTDAQVILDPFAGSGTAGIAAKMPGRKFIGIERNGEYIDQAWKRNEAKSTLARAA